MSNKLFLLGFVGAAFAAATLTNVAPSSAQQRFVGAVGFSQSAGNTLTGTGTAAQSLGVAAGPNGSFAGSASLGGATPSTAGSLTGAGGFAGGAPGAAPLVGGVLGGSAIRVTPTGSGAAALGLAGNNGNGTSGAASGISANQNGRFGSAGAGAVFGTVGTR
jgi:hypothetical protein